MRIRFLLIGVLLSIHPIYAHATTLEAAMDAATAQHPLLRIAQQNIEMARGQLIEQSSYAYNPELSLEPQYRRLNGGGTGTDYYIGLSQGIELGGKRGYRAQAAQQGLNTAKRESELNRQQLSIGAARTFVELFFAKQTLNLRNKQSVMLDKLSQAVHHQMAVGEMSQLDVNLARAAFTSALSAKMGAKQLFILNQAQYYMAVGGEKMSAPELPRLLIDWQPPEDALAIALESRPDVAALRSRLAQSHAQSNLASAGRIPDPTLSIMAGREAGEQLVKVAISFPLPLWNSHQGSYQHALAKASQAETQLSWSEQKMRLDIQAARYNHQSAMQMLNSAYQAEKSATFQHSIKLAQTAFAAGEMDLEELVIHVNQALEAQLTSIEISKQGWLARIRLAEVLGHPEYILEGIQK
ncbi:MAG: TolC family protein [Mariprofundaceae bacterium]|nr:TolC family protein [Mariprofundaceae bacterium]